MNARHLLCAILLPLSLWAQRSPTHPLDIHDIPFSQFVTAFEQWEAGKPPKGVTEMDDEFFISRQTLLPRFSGEGYAAEKGVDARRKLWMWVPVDDPTKTWKALPRYSFEGDNFSMWQYVDVQGNWTAPWFRVTAGLSDVAHRNGVKVGCLLNIPWAATADSAREDEFSRTLTYLTERDGKGGFLRARKVVDFLHYYGIDGIGINSEFYTSPAFAARLQAFFARCHEIARAEGKHFEMYWYDGTNDAGGIEYDHGLGDHNDGWLGEVSRPVSDAFFFNYNWTPSLLDTTEARAARMGRSSYDVYAGFDIQGRAFNYPYWEALRKSRISVGLWGAHTQNLLHQSATDDGTSDIAVQRAYLEKQEKTFSGGNRNPAYRPPLRTDATLSNADLTSFHGLAAFVTAKSTLQALPFVTRFGLGNGKRFHAGGKVAFNHKWYNLSIQDYLPSWRWWIVDEKGEATAANACRLVRAELTHDEAYYGGSSLRLSGATDFSRVNLFKTEFAVQPSDSLSVTFRSAACTPKARFFVALKGALNVHKDIALPLTKNASEWQHFSAPLSDFGIVAGDTIALMGLTVSEMTERDTLVVGEIRLTRPTQTFHPVAPKIKAVEILRGRHDAFDFKVRYSAREDRGVPTKNSEVDTWYYEIFFAQEGEAPQLLTATTSWAAYVIDCPLRAGKAYRRGRFGVRAVSPDGTNGSPVVWTEMQDIPYNEIGTAVTASSAVVKTNEAVTLKLEDTMAPALRRWQLTNALTDSVAAEAVGTTHLRAKIKTAGIYDLRLTDSEGKERIVRGQLEVRPRRSPLRRGKALRISDPDMLLIPGEAQRGNAFSYALWVKPAGFSHDRNGTNLLNKSSHRDKWPFNNWGDLWVVVREPIAEGQTLEEQTMQHAHAPHEIAFDVRAKVRSHEAPNEAAMTTGYSLTPGVWTHLVVTQDAERRQCVYFNGRKVAEAVCKEALRREEMGDARIDSTATADIFIGGGNVYKAAFDGWVDDVQVWNRALMPSEVLRAMQGYDGTMPPGLTAYYTFDTVLPNATFENRADGSVYPSRLVRKSGSGGETTLHLRFLPQVPKIE